MIMKNLPFLQKQSKALVFSILFLLSIGVNQLKAQSGWEVGLNAGLSLPITGYKEVLKNGWLLGAEGKYRFGNGHFAVGIETDFVRLQNDKNSADSFQNARMTLAPILFMAEYELNTRSNWKPYFSGGLGLSLFNLNYDKSPTEGKTDFNVSFTLSPQVGLRYKASDHLLPFVEYRAVLLTDGPPIGFPKSDKLTGYNAFAAGINYRF